VRDDWIHSHEGVVGAKRSRAMVTDPDCIPGFTGLAGGTFITPHNTLLSGGLFASWQLSEMGILIWRKYRTRIARSYKFAWPLISHRRFSSFSTALAEGPL
jgi:hypothetical protein